MFVSNLGTKDSTCWFGNDIVTRLWPSPVGFLQKLQGLADSTEVPLGNIFIRTHNAQQTANLRLCSLLPVHSQLSPFMRAASAAD